MCTVSYLPTPEGFILTSNRDEDPGRETGLPETFKLSGGSSVLAPRDKEKGGTWIALGENGKLGCLLNGAFGRHTRVLPYRRSRGHYVFEALDAPNFNSFVTQVNLSNIEPFTLLLIEPGNILKLLWDGRRKYFWPLSPQTRHLWSSPTLYTPSQHSEKERYFMDAIQKPGTSPEAVLAIHGRDYETPFVLNRPEVRTVSISQISFDGRQGKFQYHTKEFQNETATLVSTAFV